MKRIQLTAPLCALAVALTGCGGSNPVNGSGGSGGSGASTGGSLVENTIPEELAKNLTKISFDAASGTLTVEMTSLDDPTSTATYTRNAALDVPGYTAFSAQNDALDRMFVALAAASSDGSVQAAVVGDGGQFNRFFSGGYYERLEGNVPTSGLVSYAGTYGGVSNLNDPAGGALLPTPPGTPGEIAPGQPRQTQGDIFLNVDFTDNTVNGAIYNHQFTDGEALPSITLVVSDIDGNGEFLGSTEFTGRPDLGTNGTYGGIVGGTDGSSIAGIVALDTIFLPDDARDSNFDALIGVFVLDQCGGTGAPAVCP